MKKTILSCVTVLFLLICAYAGLPQAMAADELVATGATLTLVAEGFQFAEGPAWDSKAGVLYFTDLAGGKIHKLTPDGKVSVFVEKSGGANGLFIDRDGKVLACQGGEGRIASIDASGNVKVLADKYDGKRFNQPNDLWVDPKGGIYFSDPIFGPGDNVQGGYHVYYLNPSRDKVIRVIEDMKMPNGLVGTPDGKTLYATDWGSKKTYKYSINADGTLSNKADFAPVGSDGVDIDSLGNVYLTEASVLIYDPSGKKIGEIKMPEGKKERPTNIGFGGPDGKTLFVTTAPTAKDPISVYSIKMNVKGVF